MAMAKPIVSTMIRGISSSANAARLASTPSVWPSMAAPLSWVTVERRVWTSPVIVVPVPRVTEPSTTTSVWAVAPVSVALPPATTIVSAEPLMLPVALTSTIAPTCWPDGTSTAPSTAMIAPRSPGVGPAARADGTKMRRRIATEAAIASRRRTEGSLPLGWVCCRYRR